MGVMLAETMDRLDEMQNDPESQGSFYIRPYEIDTVQFKNDVLSKDSLKDNIYEFATLKDVFVEIPKKFDNQ